MSRRKPPPTVSDPLELVIDTRAAMEHAAGKPLPYTDAELAKVIAECVEFVGQRFTPAAAHVESDIEQLERVAREDREERERAGLQYPKLKVV